MRTSLTPNQVSIGVSLFSLLMFYTGLKGYLFTTGLLLQVASILDGVDGEMARAKKRVSEFGALLDTVLDYWMDSAGLISIGLALSVNSKIPLNIIWVIIALTITIRLISQFIVKTCRVKKAHISSETRDVTTFLIFLGCLFGSLYSSYILLAILGIINLVRIDNSIFRLYWSYLEERKAYESGNNL